MIIDFIKKHIMTISGVLASLVFIALVLFSLNVIPFNSSKDVGEETLQKASYTVKDGDALFEINVNKLPLVDKMMTIEGNFTGSKSVLVKYKDSPEVFLLTDIQFGAFNQYFEVTLKDFLKDNPDFDYSARSSLSGIGEKFGLDGDPNSFIAKQGAKNIAGTLGRALTMIFVMVVFIVILLKMQTGQLSNNIEMSKPSDIDDSLDDLVGMNDIKVELLQLEEMIMSRGLYKEYGIDKPFNVMMTGPAGTGKTKLARCLAKRLNVPLFYTSAASLESGYVGGGPRTLKKLYAKALKQKRAIIFLDEAESILSSRENHMSGSKYENDTSTTLLSLLDGVNTKGGVEIIWVVASNFDEHKMKMDEAMLRRFHLKINFRLPNHEERREILKRLVESRVQDRVCEEIDLDHIASITSSMSPAILENLITRASLLAAQDRKKIDQDILLRAFERIAVGLTDRATTGKMDEKRKVIATHEAGHFIVQIHNAMRKTKGDVTKLYDTLDVIKISTESVSKMGALGFVLSKSEDVPLQTRSEYENMVCELYGGMANEEIHYGESGVTAGAHNDIEKVTKILNKMINEVGYYNNVKLNYSTLESLGVDTGTNRMATIQSRASNLYLSTKDILIQYREMTDIIVKLLMDHYVITIDEIIPHIESFYSDNQQLLNSYKVK